MKLSDWARKELERGDLSTLSELKRGIAWGDPNPGRIERLNRRGFVAKKENEKLRVTLKGRLALWVRRHDANGQGLAYIYSRDCEAEALQAKVLTKDEARRIALNVARLPELLGKKLRNA